MPMNVLCHQGRREFWLKNNLTGLPLDIHQSVPAYPECCPYCLLGVIYSIKGLC